MEKSAQKIAIITGGAKVVIADFNEEALNQTIEQFNAKGYTVASM